MATSQASIFIYKGTDRRGKTVQGETTGSSQALVKAQLLKQGIRPRVVRKKSKPLFSNNKKIKPLDIALFTRQMATMMKAGVPLVQSFDIVAEGTDNHALKDLVTIIRNDVASGSGFAPALRKHPRYFDDLFCNLVESGEQSGALETLLDRIATYKEKTEALKAKIKKALTYPTAVIIVAIIVTMVLLIKVVPQFAETFSSFGADLPAFTLFVLGISDFVRAHWFYMLLATIGGILCVRELHRRSPGFRQTLDRSSLRTPIVGKILYNSILARYARTLATTFAAGVPLIDSLESVSGATGNIIYQRGVLTIRDQVATGVQLNQAMRSSQLFPSMMLQMTAIGEESGALDEMLGKVATFHEEAVDNMVDNLTSLLEPMIMSILGVLVGGLLIAMYLPIFQLGAVV
ncbi:MAG: type II secretion system F family protein [Cellvibrionaceae bacterium]|nr:type II secretion system F family protein [Cellvibrionaceae bacterium]